MNNHSPPQGQPQLKRARYPRRETYAPSACFTCRSRKVKCSGDTPCQRCVKFGLECIYDPNRDDVQSGNKKKVARSENSDDVAEASRLQAIDDKLAGLQDQMDLLLSRTSLPGNQRGDYSNPPRLADSVLYSAETDSFAHPNLVISRSSAPTGPNDVAFGFGESKQADSLRPLAGTRIGSISTPQILSPQGFSCPNCNSNVFERDLILEIGEVEVMRLIQVYQDGIGAIYPCLDIGIVKKKARKHWTQSISRDSESLYGFHESEEYGSFDRDGEILKLTLAIALVFESRGSSQRAAELMDSAERVMWKRMNIVEVDLKELLIFILMSIYHFNIGEEVLAYRTAGLAGRGALEMGLHRRETWLWSNGIFPGDLVRSWALRLFWCIYVLDREWSLGTGMPFALQDSDIDTEPLESFESTPYLTAMVSYGRLGSNVWNLASSYRNATKLGNSTKCAELDSQIEKWAQGIPFELRLSASGDYFQESDRTLRLLRVLLHLRRNHMRILIYRPDVFSARATASDSDSAFLVTEVAKDTIKILSQLNETSTLYGTYHTTFNHFLVSALAVLLLAVCHEPARFGQSCHADFNVGLDLIKGFSVKSYSSSRLWNTIQRLKEKNPSQSQSTGATSLAIGNNSGQLITQTSQNSLSSESTRPAVSQEQNLPQNDDQMSYDLRSMFEAAGGAYVEPSSTDNFMPGYTGGGQLIWDGPFIPEDDVFFSELLMDLF